MRNGSVSLADGSLESVQQQLGGASAAIEHLGEGSDRHQAISDRGIQGGTSHGGRMDLYFRPYVASRGLEERAMHPTQQSGGVLLAGGMFCVCARAPELTQTQGRARDALADCEAALALDSSHEKSARRRDRAQQELAKCGEAATSSE